MGTSNSFGGGKNANPLIPDWLSGDDKSTGTDVPGKSPVEKPKEKKEVVPPNRFNSARRNFNAFSREGGGKGYLKKAISAYVSKSAGGARNAGRRMAVEKRAIRGFGSFLSDISQSGLTNVIKKLNLSHLVGLTPQEIYTAVVDMICGTGGDLDNAFARDAYIETMAQIEEAGLDDLERPSQETITFILERFIANAIRIRILNTIGNNAVMMPDDPDKVTSIYQQLKEFIEASTRDLVNTLGADIFISSVQEDIDKLFEQSFDILEALADKEEDDE